MNAVTLVSDCPRCGKPTGMCRLFDKNGNRHVWTWCEPCYAIFKTVPRDIRPEGLDIDSLPLYLTKAQQKSGTQPVFLKTRQPHALLENPLQKIVDEYRRLLLSLPYELYLQTEHWQSMRKDAVARADAKCQLCNSPKRLNVHHRTYERRGEESDSDLIVLCRPCHAKFHDKLP